MPVLPKCNAGKRFRVDADIVVFDPETISDVGTYEAPNQPAIGVQSLLVNGKLVIGAAPGQPIRRPVKK